MTGWQGYGYHASAYRRALNLARYRAGRRFAKRRMQQAARVSDYTGFFLLGEMVEFDEPTSIFTNPRDRRKEDYITGRFG